MLLPHALEGKSHLEMNAMVFLMSVVSVAKSGAPLKGTYGAISVSGAFVGTPIKCACLMRDLMLITFWNSG